MQRIPEPELMNGIEQAKAYSKADFSEPHDAFVQHFRKCFPEFQSGSVLDLGCGPGDITVRFAKAFPGCLVHGMDGAPNMLKLGRERIDSCKLAHRIRLIQGFLPKDNAPEPYYDAIISNSLLHHLPDPTILWNAINKFSKPGTTVFVMDLMRPTSEEEARAMVERYSGGEPQILKNDFYHSLLASYTVDEVKNQLTQAKLHYLKVESTSDRHFVVSGVV